MKNIQITQIRWNQNTNSHTSLGPFYRSLLGNSNLFDYYEKISNYLGSSFTVSPQSFLGTYNAKSNETFITKEAVTFVVQFLTDPILPTTTFPTPSDSMVYVVLLPSSVEVLDFSCSNGCGSFFFLFQIKKFHKQQKITNSYRDHKIVGDTILNLAIISEKCCSDFNKITVSLSRILYGMFSNPKNDGLSFKSQDVGTSCAGESSDFFDGYEISKAMFTNKGCVNPFVSQTTENQRCKPINFANVSFNQRK